MLLLGNMRCRNFVAVTFCVLILMIYQAKADKEDKSEEIPPAPPEPQQPNPPSSPSTTTRSASTDSVAFILNTTTSTSSEEGPPDSHEAMHNRELKPKLTVGRDKRSYQFLVGLVRNQSGFEMTRAGAVRMNALDEQDLRDAGERNDSSNSDGQIDMKAAGDLMEMLVKISSHPKEWKSVHEMLVEIDNDLQKSKRILDGIDKTPSSASPPKVKSPTTAKKSHTAEHRASINSQQKVFDEIHADVVETGQTDNMKKWPPFDETETFAAVSNQPQRQTDHTLESHSVKNNGVDSTKASYPHNFAYHRVTGRPLYHHANSKGPKAYIAVSVIAAKNPTERDDINLENELRQLKPWTHQQNLKNMADLRSKWVIQSSKERSDDSDDDNGREE